ncbi:MAG: hypothetical protein R3D55_07140 [Chloroflexota bacterium]
MDESGRDYGRSHLGLLDADALMREHNIRRLPVVENGRISWALSPMGMFAKPGHRPPIR